MGETIFPMYATVPFRMGVHGHKRVYEKVVE